MRKLCYLFFATFFTLSFNAQVEVDQTFTIEEYVNDILLGSGISASNITFTGWDEQIGYMTGADGTIFSIDGGLVLSSADASNLAEDLGTNVPFGEGISGDQDLLDIANSVPPLIGQSFSVSSVNDIATLEFDFIATGDTMKFNYVFGSDEYLTWVNTSFNDIFGFFLSGPGLSGPYDSPAGFPDGAINIAEVPNSDPSLPVTISSVNDQLNSEYFIYNNPNEDVFINGFTTVFEAMSPVMCGETYHIKLAIADGTDTILESIVVLEEGSFESNSVVEVTLETDVGIFYEDAIIYEDCGIASLTFTRPIETILEVEEMVLITYSGTAENGVDFTLLPDTVIFPPFVETVEFEVDAFVDGIEEGEEIVIFEILNLAACNGGGLTSYFEFVVDDYPDPLTVEGYDISICNGDTVTLEPIISGGYGNFDFTWDNGGDTYTIDVWPDVTTSYNVVVTDTCAMPPDDADFTVEVQDWPELTVEIDQGDVELDCGESINLTATASGGDGNYVEWFWYDEDGDNLFGWENSLWFSTWSGADQVFVEVTDGCGFTATASINATFNIPELFVEMEPTLTVNCNSPFTLEPDIDGGQDPYWYNWYVDGSWVDWNSQLNWSTDEDITVMVQVQDNCGQQEEVETLVEVESPPVILDMPEELTGSCITVFDIDANVTSGSGGYSYSWTENGDNLGNTSSIDFQSDVTTVVTLTVEDGCSQEGIADIIINIVNPPLIVDLGEDINASCIDNTDILAEILDGSGGYEYTWYVDGNEVGTDNTLTWQSFETVDVAVSVTDGCGGFDQDTVTLIIPDIPLELSLTPDTAICLGRDITLTALAEGGEGGFVYYWPSVDEYGEALETTPFSSTQYNVIATDICGDQISGSVVVGVVELLSDFNATYLNEEDVQFDATPSPEDANDNYTYIWNFGDGDVAFDTNPLHTYDALGSYEASLIVINEIGCIDTAYFTYHSPPVIYIPNAFTPNNDGVNDVWAVHGMEMLRYEMTVFNRWGEMVFRSEDPDEVWTGSMQGGDHFVPNGTYTYICKVKGINSDAWEKVGTVTLMR